MKERAVFVYSEQELAYRFHEHHPFNQRRLAVTVDLLQTLGALPAASVIPPAVIGEQDLLRIHTKTYLEAAQRLSLTETSDEELQEAAARFGLGTEDTPCFPGMHEASARLAGGTLLAAEQVMSGRAVHALHLGGGLHHAHPGRASGFCVYNDAAAAIAAVKAAYGVKVLYVDTDVHHGDGVQWVFYADPRVCTFSIHETGKYLFPGTGGVQERGEGDAFGSSVNVPVEPYTEDDSWLECFTETLERIAASFQPDLIVSQHGCDAHAFDPLSHIHCSMRIYLEMPRIIHRLAHRYCEGRWVALGGGGYDIWRVVPRAWSLLWLEMTDHPLLESLRSDSRFTLPPAWLARWQPSSPHPLPKMWLDPLSEWKPIPRRKEIERKNRQMAELALMYLPHP